MIVMYQVCFWFMKFILFSVLGYVVEMIECAIDEKRFNNRGFFCGPIIPIFGVGSILVILFLNPLRKHWLMVFLLGIFVTTFLEYIVGYGLEKIFHNKWWDYSDEKFNFQGRICLKNSILFGVGTLLIIYVLNPYIGSFLLQLKDGVLIGLSIVIAVLFMLDFIYSSIVAYHLRHQIIVVEDLKNQKLAKLPGMFEKMVKSQKKSFFHLPKRLLKAFPSLLKNHEKEFAILRKLELKQKEKKRKEKEKKKQKRK